MNLKKNPELIPLIEWWEKDGKQLLLYYEFVVPEGEMFVMGDHRDNSTDSRDPGVGTIDIDAILGKVLIRFYPFEDGKFGKVE
mgnify:CR=1 FL=1